MKRAVMTAMLLFPSWVFAESIYVNDQVSVGIYQGIANQEPLLKRVTTGIVLQVLERRDDFIRVREPGGVEGWVEAEFMTLSVPAVLQLKAARADLEKARAELARLKPALIEAQALAKESDTALAREKSLTQDLAGRLEQRMTPDTMAGPEPERSDSSDGSNLLWIVISFAMLGIGFMSGVIWLRENNRRKLGGRYLKI
ncbi:MAG: hypothetical protein BMS9Abin36_0703 [Gammaproteobacteria bacterium]|nr:MAG: hypothetical protein BMS9Abin36_0703 [Gammaproteobacteria bacterium]